MTHHHQHHLKILQPSKDFPPATPPNTYSPNSLTGDSILGLSPHLQAHLNSLTGDSILGLLPHLQAHLRQSQQPASPQRFLNIKIKELRHSQNIMMKICSPMHLLSKKLNQLKSMKLNQLLMPFIGK
jgi:hypothetical protein